MQTASWIIVSKDTGQAVFETFNQRVADAVNREKYEVRPAAEHLASLNAKPVKDNEIDLDELDDPNGSLELIAEIVGFDAPDDDDKDDQPIQPF